MTDISKYDDVIDSRDVIDRIEELESELAEYLDATDGEDIESFPDIDELRALRALAAEASQYSSEWQYGETLIRYSYWQEYVQELLVDCGEIPKNIPFYIVIDWQETAENIAQDYATVKYGGVDYYIRNIYDYIRNC